MKKKNQKKMTMSREQRDLRVQSFLSRVNKLTVGRRTSDPVFGTVTLLKRADQSRGFCARLKRMGYGTRQFAVSGSGELAPGRYSLGGIRAALRGC